MSEVETPEVETPAVDELETLKHRADMLGIKYHPSIGVEKLREKVMAALEDDAPKDQDKVEGPVDETTPYQKAAKLVRIRVANMNPDKRHLKGEIFTAGNRVVGTFKKYVPYDTAWHVPTIIYNMIRDKQCLVHVTKKHHRGVPVVETKLIKAYSVEVLPDLTQAELDELTRRNALAEGSEE